MQSSCPVSCSGAEAEPLFFDMSNAKVRHGPHVEPEIAKHAAAELDCSRALCRQSAGA